MQLQGVLQWNMSSLHARLLQSKPHCNMEVLAAWLKATIGWYTQICPCI